MPAMARRRTPGAAPDLKRMLISAAGKLRLQHPCAGGRIGRERDTPIEARAGIERAGQGLAGKIEVPTREDVELSVHDRFPTHYGNSRL